jgi:hypothetical protein
MVQGVLSYGELSLGVVVFVPALQYMLSNFCSRSRSAFSFEHPLKKGKPCGNIWFGLFLLCFQPFPQWHYYLGFEILLFCFLLRRWKEGGM